MSQKLHPSDSDSFALLTALIHPTEIDPHESYCTCTAKKFGPYRPWTAKLLISLPGQSGDRGARTPYRLLLCLEANRLTLSSRSPVLLSPACISRKQIFTSISLVPRPSAGETDLEKVIVTTYLVVRY